MSQSDLTSTFPRPPASDHVCDLGDRCTRSILFCTGRIRGAISEEYPAEPICIRIHDDGYRLYYSYQSGGPIDNDAAENHALRPVDPAHTECFAEYKHSDVPRSVIDFLMAPRRGLLDPAPVAAMSCCFPAPSSGSGYQHEPLQIGWLFGVITSMVSICHQQADSAGWWSNEHKRELALRSRYGLALIAEKLALIHGEISEGLEGLRKNKMDEHLPHRTNLEVELADAAIRIFDLSGALGLDLGGAIAEKLRYNSTRADHTQAARNAEGGKVF